MREKQRALFLCTHNAARSQVLLRREKQGCSRQRKSGRQRASVCDGVSEFSMSKSKRIGVQMIASMGAPTDALKARFEAELAQFDD